MDYEAGDNGLGPHSAIVKRVLLVEFVQSPDAPSRAADMVAEHGMTICGWAARPKDTARHLDARPDIPFFALKESEGKSERGVSDVRFQSDEEETILYLLDRERSFQNHLHSS